MAIFDYKKIPHTDVAAAVSDATAYEVIVIPQGATVRMMSIDNGFDVDMVVMVGTKKPLYLRSGDAKVLDLQTNEASLPPASGGISIKVYAESGTPPSQNFLILDSLF